MTKQYLKKKTKLENWKINNKTMQVVFFIYFLKNSFLFLISNFWIKNKENISY